MKAVRTNNLETVNEVVQALKQNDWYCPCKIEKIQDNKCMCKDFRENTAVGDFCHCGLYKKIED